MKKMNFIKFSLDVVMALLFVLFFNARVLGGQPFHEIAGLVFAVMYFTHIFLNWKWVVNVTRKLFDRKLPWNIRGSYALNLLLLISMSFVIISGVLISKVVFPNIQVTNQMWFRITHIAVSFLVLLLVGIHTGLHWQWVVNVWKKMWRFKSKSLLGRYAARTLTVLVLLFGLYEINSTGFINQLSGVTSVFGVNTQNIQQGHDGGPDFQGAGGGGQEFHGPRDGMGPVGGQQMNSNSIAPSSAQNFQFNQNASQFPGGEMRHHDGGQVNFLSVIATYTGIMAVFIIITYYLRKWLGRSKKRRKIRV